MRIARAAESAGVAMVAVHGRTREQGYNGRGRVRHGRGGEGARCASRSSPTATSTRRRKARAVLARTGADAIMIGRAAQGRPWIFREIAHFLATGEAAAAAARAPTCRRWLLEHLTTTIALYGEFSGVRSARKHIGWTVRGAARRRGVPRGDEHDRVVRGAGRARSPRWFDRLGRRASPVMPRARARGSRQRSD